MFKPIQGAIARRVMKAIELRIEKGQKQYDEECEKIDAEAFQRKLDAEQRIVDSIVA